MGSADRIEELTRKFDENPRRYFAPLANELRKAGNHEQAIALCRQHLADQPGHLSGHIVWGQALFETGRDDEAAQVFASAIGLDPQNLIALRHLGDIARRAGDPAAALHWYRRILEADPHDLDITALVAELEGASGAAPVALPQDEAPGAGAVPPSAEAPTLEWLAPSATPTWTPAAPEPVADSEAPTRGIDPPAMHGATPLAGSEEPDPFGFDSMEMPSAAEILAGPASRRDTNPLAGLSLDVVDPSEGDLAGSLVGSGAPIEEPEPIAGLMRGSGFVDASNLPDGPDLVIEGGRVSGSVDVGENPLADLLTHELVPEPLPFGELAHGDEVVAAPPQSSPVGPAASGVVDAAPFVTVSMAEVLERQGLDAQAASVYRDLLARQPGDPVVQGRLAVVEARLAAAGAHPASAGESARSWFARLGRARRREAPVVAERLPAQVAFPTPVAPQAVVAPAPDGLESPRPDEVLSTLFGPPTNDEDEVAARALAALFDGDAAGEAIDVGAGSAAEAVATVDGGVAEDSPPGAATPPWGVSASAAPVAAARDRASDGLPASEPPRPTRSFSFDQFFSAVPRQPTPSSSSEADAEIAEFTRWLGDLKQQS